MKDYNAVVAYLQAAGVVCDSLSVDVDGGAITVHLLGETVAVTEAVITKAVAAVPDLVPPTAPPTLASIIAAELPKVRADPSLNAASKAALDVIITAAKG